MNIFEFILKLSLAEKAIGLLALVIIISAMAGFASPDCAEVIGGSG